MRSLARIFIVVFAVVLALGLAVFGSGCEEKQIITPERNLDRPTAIAFFCAGPLELGGDVVAAYAPQLCNPDLWWCLLEDDDDCRELLEERALFGVIVNSNRGELALANLHGGVLVDLAEHQPGFGFVPVGSTPVAVDTSNDGCASVVANSGSCDVSIVNNTALLMLAGFDTVDGTSTAPAVSRLALRTDSGRLLSRPHDLIVVPKVVGGPPPVQACATLQGYRAYVSFPDCALVAEVDLNSGRIVQSVTVGPTGVRDAGSDPRCRKQCPDFWGDGVTGDATSSDRPAHLAFLSFETTGSTPILYIAPDLGSYVAAVEIGFDDRFNIGRSRIIPLEDIDRGIRKIRLSPPTLVSDWLFLYVVTRDGDIRVIDADVEVECETNPDPRADVFSSTNWESWGRRCIEVGHPEVPRAPLSKTPGIDIPGNRQVVDVAFATVFAEGLDVDLDPLDPLRVAGNFAWALTQDGQAYVINIDEDFDPTDDNGNGIPDHLEQRREDGIQALMAHQIRNLTDTNEEGGVHIDPEYDYLLAGELTNEPPANITLNPDVLAIIDKRTAVSEGWTLDFEGLLPGGTRSTGYVFKPNPAVDATGTADFIDNAASFCAMGTEPGDVLVILGCEDDDDCGDGFACLRNLREDQENGGLCVEERYVNNDLLTEICLPLALGSREYEVLEAYDHELLLGPLPAPGMPCAGAADCPTTAPDGTPHTFLCESGRCVLDCTATDDASQPLETCESVSGVCDHDGTVGRCVRAPLPDLRVSLPSDVTWCLPSFVTYQVRAGEMFLLTGSSTGILMRRDVDLQNDDVCIDDPDVSPLQHSRVPLTTDPFENPILRLALTGITQGQWPGRGDGIQFQVVAGFRATFLDVAARLPVMVAAAPDGFMYIVDSGDDVLDVGGVFGQLLRLFPADLGLDTGFIIR